MGYVYQADVYCDECGESICHELQADHPELVPEDYMDQGSYDSGDYPKSADVEHEESDVPEHCIRCRKFLRNPLTSRGYANVKTELDLTGESKFSKLGEVWNKWAHWYNFTFWDQADCDDYFQDERKRVPGWYSSEAF